MDKLIDVASVVIFISMIMYAASERTPAYRGGGFLLQREQHH